MKAICNYLGWINVVAGIVESIVTAYNVLDFFGSWGLSIGSFFAVLFSAAIISSILFALAAIIDKQDYYINEYRNNSSSGILGYSNEVNKMGAGEWECKCKRFHSAYETSCPVCKMRK